MAVTGFVVAKVTEHSLSLLVTADANPAAAMAVPNATMRGYFTALGFTGPMSRLLDTDGLASQAQARARALGDASGLAAQDLRDTEHCSVRIVPRTLVGPGWIVDADQDGVTATRFELNITDPGTGFCTALVTLDYRQTVDR